MAESNWSTHHPTLPPWQLYLFRLQVQRQQARLLGLALPTAHHPTAQRYNNACANKTPYWQRLSRCKLMSHSDIVCANLIVPLPQCPHRTETGSQFHCHLERHLQAVQQISWRAVKHNCKKKKQCINDI